MEVIARMERMIEAERNPIRRWAMLKVLANTLKRIEVNK